MTALPITLPEGFTPLVKKGDNVFFGQTLAQKAAPQDEIVNIMEAFKLSRPQAQKAVKRIPGERISPGDIIAVKKNFLGQVKGTIVSEVSGIILRYERDTGNLVVRTDIEPSSLEIISPVAGTVSLCNNKEIVIETKNALVTQGVALGSTGEGTLFVLQESFGENGSANALFYLDDRATGNIVLVHTVTRELLIKGDSIGAAGFLAVVIPDEDISYVQEKGIELPVLEVAEELVEKLHPWKDKKILVDITSKAIILREE